MQRLTRRHDIAGLGVALALSLGTAVIGALASVQASTFYAQLAQPAWAPPAWLFGPVWSVLYVMMGVAAWLVWRSAGAPHTRTALSLYIAQLAANALWSWLFFAWHLGALAVIDILVLWMLILATLIAFWRINRLAGVLLAPYLLWVSLAAALNYVTWQLNPQLLG